MTSHWRLQALIVVVAQTLAVVAFLFPQAFLPYYLASDLGVSDAAAIGVWVGVCAAAPPLVTLLCMPFWGVLGDRIGQKPLLFRSILGIGGLLLLAGLAQAPWQLLAVQLTMGVFGGVNALALVMLSLLAPRRYLGTALGWGQTGRFVGYAVAPGLGGLTADLIGFRAAFAVAGCVSLAVALIAWRLLPNPRPLGEPSTGGGPHGGLRFVLTQPEITRLIGLAALVNLAFVLATPYLPLRLAELQPGHPNLATLSGLVLTAGGVAAALGGLAIGRVTHRWGYRRPLVALAAVGALLQVMQAVARTPEQLLVARFVAGLAFGGLSPLVHGLLALATPAARRGAVFSVTHSAQAVAHFSGPLAASVLVLAAGVAAPLVAGGLPLALAAALAWRTTREPDPERV